MADKEDFKIFINHVDGVDPSVYINWPHDGFSHIASLGVDEAAAVDVIVKLSKLLNLSLEDAKRFYEAGLKEITK